MLQGEEVMVTKHQGRDVELQLAHEALAAEGGDQVLAGDARDGRHEEGELLLSVLRLHTGAHRLGHQRVREPGCQCELQRKVKSDDLTSYLDDQSHQTNHCV